MVKDRFQMMSILSQISQIKKKRENIWQSSAQCKDWGVLLLAPVLVLRWKYPKQRDFPAAAEESHLQVESCSRGTSEQSSGWWS